MFDNKLITLQDFQPADTHPSGKNYAYLYNLALTKFKATLFNGKVSRLKNRVLNRRQSLYDLNTLKPDLHVHGSFYAGIRVVPIGAIIGSEGRVADFDIDFHPRSEAARERWINVALAHLSNLPLPPVELIQIGDAYFVRDGHHRISISRACGQIAVDAEVITWKASPPFPWQPEACAENPNLLKSAHPST